MINDVLYSVIATSLPPKSETMKILKYSLITAAVVVGSEVMYKCLKYMLALLHKEGCDRLKKDSSEWNEEKIFNKVLFFPDQGILARNIGKDCIPEEKDRDNEYQYGYKYHNHSKDVITPRNDTTAPRSLFLKRSTSLVYLIDAIDSAKHSLKVCVYVITLQDMVNALLRAKSRGVLVRVILEGQMPSEVAVAALRKHNIAVQVSRSSYLMHHKFALVDAPITHHEVVPCDKDSTKFNETACGGRLNSYLDKRSFLAQSSLKVDSTRPLLLTGSFNWTWTAVINNFENVVLSNDLNLISQYNKEFEYLWENLKV